MEDETALSIVDPVTINCELTTRSDDSGNAIKVLQVRVQYLQKNEGYRRISLLSEIFVVADKFTSTVPSFIVPRCTNVFTNHGITAQTNDVGSK